MTPGAGLQVHVSSHPGKLRAVNEDAVASLAASPATGDQLSITGVVLADGLGGRRAGDVASRLATASMSASLRAWGTSRGSLGNNWQSTLSAELDEMVRRTHRQLRQRAETGQDTQGMATTLVALILVQDWYATVHVGDSRCYLWRDGVLRQLTLDHSWGEDQRLIGALADEEISQSPFQVQLVRAVGVDAEVNATIEWGRAMPGDLFLACTDGLTKSLSGPEIASLLARKRRLPALANGLIAAANSQGGDDNVSVGLLLVQTLPQPGLPQSLPRTEPVGIEAVRRAAPVPEYRPLKSWPRFLNAPVLALGAGLFIALGVVVAGLIPLQSAHREPLLERGRLIPSADTSAPIDSTARDSTTVDSTAFHPRQP